ncbi:AlpA family transcriptional regulator [Pusillimonas sp. ANT_WB101]|uniref:helix-turn-helix transcriptional regulator n=1 Tax=Pusillimonas sp. ANT_WB101 TaxID=2597356 RepID=UPI002101E87D|nr:AlpA family phage regulatory protein [Pusillimonas sp. ANT_WB101]
MKGDIDGLVAALSALIAQQQDIANLAARLQQHALAPDQNADQKDGVRIQRPMFVSTTAPPLFVRMKDLPALTGISRAEIYRKIAAGSFPRPVSLGTRAVAWRIADLQAWANSLQVQDST